MGSKIQLPEGFYNSHITFTSVNLIIEISRPLLILGLSYFTFDRTYKDGTHVRLTNHGNWIESYYRQALFDRAVFEKDPRLFTNGFVFWDFLNREPVYSAASKFDIDHGLTVIETHDNYTDFYHFGTRCDNPIPKEFLIKNIELLYRFIAYFKEKAKKILIEAENTRFVLPSSQREDIKAKDINLKRDLELAQLLIDTHVDRLYLGEEFDNKHLTRREIDILSLLIQGNKMPEVSKLLNVSIKTLETQIKKIKDKLKCGTLFEAGFILGSLSTKHIFPFKIS